MYTSMINIVHNVPAVNVSGVLLSTGKDYPIQASTKNEMLVWVKAIENDKVSLTCPVYM